MKIGEILNEKQFLIKGKENKIKVSRGDVFLINCKNIDCFGREKTIGIVLQNNKGNHFSPCTIIAFAKFNNVLHKSDLCFDITNISTVDKTRLIKKLGELPAAKMHFINKGLMDSITGFKNELELLVI